MNIEQGMQKVAKLLDGKQIVVADPDGYKPPEGWRPLRTDELRPGLMCGFAYMDIPNLTSILITGIHYTGRGKTRGPFVTFVHLDEALVEKGTTPFIQLDRSGQSFSDRFVVLIAASEAQATTE